MLKKIAKNIFQIFGYEIIRRNKSNKIFWPGQLQTAQTSFEADEEFHNLYEHAQSKTIMKNTDNPLRRQRHYTLIQLLRHSNIEMGDVCELGCWRGLSAYEMAHYIRQKNKQTAFNIFDSFEGLSEIQPIDMPAGKSRDDESMRKQFACSLETAQKNLSEFNFIRYYKGWIPDRFHEVKNRSFSFVHIDVDLYQPICDSFQFFYPRLIKHGIMVFDDYGCTQFPGAKKAIDKCLKEISNPFFISLPSGSAFLIKDFECQ